MKQILNCENRIDADGNPTGGTVRGLGVSVDWQDGPLGRGEEERSDNWNGAFVEDLLRASLQRLQFYQNSKFSCRENALAITKIEEALMWLDARTTRRNEEGTEGTHQV